MVGPQRAQPVHWRAMPRRRETAFALIAALTLCGCASDDGSAAAPNDAGSESLLERPCTTACADSRRRDCAGAPLASDTDAKGAGSVVR